MTEKIITVPRSPPSPQKKRHQKTLQHKASKVQNAALDSDHEDFDVYLKPIHFQRKDKYGKIIYERYTLGRKDAWGNDQPYPGEDRIAVLVHFSHKGNDRDPMPELKSKYMSYKTLQKLSENRLTELPAACRFGADLWFHESEASFKRRLKHIAVYGNDEKFKKKGFLAPKFIKTRSDPAGYAAWKAQWDKPFRLAESD